MQQAASSTIRKFTDLQAWKESHQLAILVYSSTKSFPKEEQFGLTNQIRRAAVSVSSNIAEGFSRATKDDKRHFYTVAKGSLTEVQSQLLLARDIGFLKNDVFKQCSEVTITVHKLLTGLIKALNAGKGVKT